MMWLCRPAASRRLRPQDGLFVNRTLRLKKECAGCHVGRCVGSIIAAAGLVQAVPLRVADQINGETPKTTGSRNRNQRMREPKTRVHHKRDEPTPGDSTNSRRKPFPDGGVRKRAPAAPAFLSATLTGPVLRGFCGFFSQNFDFFFHGGRIAPARFRRQGVFSPFPGVFKGKPS